MKRVIQFFILFVILSIGCTKKRECTKSYLGISLSGATRTFLVNETAVSGWYRSDSLSNELNFIVDYDLAILGIHNPEGIIPSPVREECKSVTQLHYLDPSTISLFCSNQLVIGADTIFRDTNLIQYFKQSPLTNEETKEIELLEYDSQRFPLPVFESINNHFRLEVTLTDGKKMANITNVKLT